jgi:hypothetical protein
MSLVFFGVFLLLVFRGVIVTFVAIVALVIDIIKRRRPC